MKEIIKEFLANHVALETALGFCIFFGGYLFAMLVGAYIGDKMDERKDKKEKD